MRTGGPLYPRWVPSRRRRLQGSFLLDGYESRFTAEQADRFRKIHDRLVEARRELDALIGDAYLRPRANIVPVHFLDLSAAVEKLRWAEKEWRELDRELAAEAAGEEAGDRIEERIPAEATSR